MSAVVFTVPTGFDALHSVDTKTPVPATGEVLVSIEAATINPVDIATVSGAFGAALPGSAPWVPGWDAAGTVLDIGDGVDPAKVGQRVIVFSPWFSQGEGLQQSRAVLTQDQVAPVNTDLTSAELASVTLNGLTALQALERTGLATGQRLAIAGASGEVGRLLTAIARARGIEVTPLGRNTTDTELATITADALINAAPADSRWLRALRERGTAITLTGPLEPQRNVNVIEFAVSTNLADLTHLAQLIATGIVTPNVGRTFPARDAARAYRAFAGQEGHARVVLTF